MRLSAVAALMILTTVFLSGCGQTQQASLDDRSQNYYGRQGVQTASRAITQMAAAVTSVASMDLPAPQTPIVTPKPVTYQNTSAVIRPLAANWQWPVEGKVTQRFGKQRDGIANEGITIAAAEGTPIRAAQSGEVAYVGSNVRDYGNMVILRHGNGDMSSYAHAKDVAVRKGQQVAAGEVIGHVGRTGRAKEPQLHFALREGDHAIDPMRKLPSFMASN